MTDAPSYVPRYRVVSSELGHEPQMSFDMPGGERWIPLNLEGYWADPDETGESAGRVRFIVSDLGLAQRAIVRAQATNKTNISTVKLER